MHTVIFDVDGTLWDSTDTAALAWIDACSGHDVPTEQITGSRLKKEFGKRLEDIGFSLFPDAPKEESLEITRTACARVNDFILRNPPEVYPEIPELFKILKEEKIPIYIVSNCQSGYIDALLDVSGLKSYVSGHLCAGDTHLEKSGSLILAAGKWHMESPVYVGDTYGDYCATKEAGFPFIFASYGFGSVPEPDGVIRTPLELPAVLRQLDRR